MALSDDTRLVVVPATRDGKETSTTWARFKVDHPDLTPEQLARIEEALEAGIAYQHQPARDAPVVYVVRRADRR